MIEYLLMPDGRRWIPVDNPSTDEPESISEPLRSWRVKEGDGQVPVRVDHDKTPRTLFTVLKQTNEMFVPRRWYLRDDGQWRVDQYSKISFWPERLSPEWQAYFFKEMTDKQHDKFNTHGFGWRDSQASPDELNIYNFLLCGGNLLKKIGSWREWTLFATQDTDKLPEDVTYEDAPHKWFKQYLIGNDVDKNPYWVVDKGVVGGIGDLLIPTACPGGIAAILSEQVVELPKLPFSTSINGYSLTFMEYAFSGSNTYGKATNGKWYVIEEMLVIGSLADKSLGGSWLDRRVYVESWPVPAPVAVIGWKGDYNNIVSKWISRFINMIK